MKKCTCGEPLLAALDEDTIHTLDGEDMVFRRDTDYLLCGKCLRVWSMEDLRNDQEPATEEEALLKEIAGADFRPLPEEVEEDDRVPLEDQFE